MREFRTSEEIARYEWLISADGRNLLARIRESFATGLTPLKIAEQLRDVYPADRVALAMTQHDLRAKAKAKFPDADHLFFTREGLEQATSSIIASHRAGRFRDARSIIDLCCGIGGDLMCFSADHVTGVDLDPVHVMLAEENVRALAPEKTIRTIQADVRDVELAPFDAAFIDPARRSKAGRFGRAISEPPLEWAISCSDHVSRVGIKTTPGLPHELIPPDWEMETIALGTDLKGGRPLVSPDFNRGPDGDRH